MDHPKPWLRYVEAGRVQDRTLALDGMKVRNDVGEKLGTIDGLIVDNDTGRTYYLVVNAPGWFSSRQWLLPIGLTHLDDDRRSVVAHLSREHVNHFPGFDKDEFEMLSETDIKRINDEIATVLEPTASYNSDEPYYAAWSREFYEYPDWWQAMPVMPIDPLDPSSADYYRDDTASEKRAKTLKRERSQQLEPAEVHDDDQDDQKDRT